MTAATYDLIIEQGATLQQTFYWTDSAGAAVNLTGYTAQMMVKANYADSGAVALLTLTSAGGTIVLTAGTGKIDLLVPPATTQALTFTKAIYDLELTSAGGVVTRLVQGNVFLSKEVTR
ncbi:MAG: hypothetical protein HXX17_08240 [Geobacteraceae bacterium]|nr:hypothetical protein [Geobacteraceae bacterium]